MAELENIAISASAGSGKTYQLAHRYIGLLARGVPPERICALTFSRKAASEIFDSIVRYLCDAALEHAKTSETADRIGRPDLTEKDFLRLLRVFVDKMNGLRIGTLDSFIVSVIRSFPLELGISPALELAEEDGAGSVEVHREVLGRILGSPAIRGSGREFIEAFRQATFGHEEKNLERQLDGFVGDFRAFYLAAPSAQAWGNEEAIWGGKSPWPKPFADISGAADELAASVSGSGWPEKAQARWRVFIEAAREFDLRAAWSGEIGFLFEKLVAAQADLRRGSASLIVDRHKCELSERQCQLARKLVVHVVGVELHRALEQTRGIHQVLERYEKARDRLMRGGRMTFTDAQRLLCAGQSGGATISGNAERRSGAERKLYIDFRLNSKLDHWLLDEFQDTSDLQWGVLSNIVDEILQDDSGRRSFFYVGDVKQAIYGWRGGNARLFGEILDAYKPRIRAEPLSTSYRSAQAVIDVVNKVFGRLPDVLPGEAVRQWGDVWQEHRCEAGRVPRHGYAALLEPPPGGGKGRRSSEAKKAEAREVAAALLREIEPLEKRLTVGVLVRENKAGREIADFLRAECPGMTIAHEGQGGIKDNPAVPVILALAKLAAHPGDTLAWRHVEMSPLGGMLGRPEYERARISLQLLRDIHERGFHFFVRKWGRMLDSVRPLDGFGAKRVRDLAAAAGDFDSTGSRDCNSFVEFVGGRKIDEPASESAVRVMTVHQAKGLEFDMVILPDLMGFALETVRGLNVFAARDSGMKAPRWVLKAPRKEAASADKVLRAELRKRSEDACMEELRVLYVAMTRAKRALYMVTSHPGRSAEAVNAAAFLKIQLVGDMKTLGGDGISISGTAARRLFEHGARDWHGKIEAPARAGPEESAPELPPDFQGRESARKRLVRIEPAAQERREESAGRLFSARAREAMDAGTAVHGLMERIEWIDGIDVEPLLADRLSAARWPESVRLAAGENVRNALRSEEIRRLLSRPAGPADRTELWREKPFELVIGARLISGKFDRVVISRDSRGTAVEAAIIDYKTDRIADESGFEAAIEQYRGQLTLYGEALSKILGLARSKISLLLLFTHAGRVCRVER